MTDARADFEAATVANHAGALRTAEREWERYMLRLLRENSSTRGFAKITREQFIARYGEEAAREDGIL